MAKTKAKAFVSCVLTLCMMIQPFPAYDAEVSAQEKSEVVIDALEYGADPTGKEDSAEAIQRAFAAAKEASENGAESVTVSFPKGEYHIYKDRAQTREYHTSNTNSIENPIKTIGLLIEEQENFTLDGNGSLFMMHGNMMALAVVHSKNVTLKDFSWDFGVPTVTEMTVTGMGTEDGKDYTEFLIPECFPHSISGSTFTWHSEQSPYTGEYYWTQTGNHNPTYAVVGYQPDGDMSRNYSTSDGPFQNVSSIREIDDTHIRIVYSSSRPSMQKMGTVIELAANAHRQTAGAFTWESENVTSRNVNVHYMHGFGWLIQMSKDVYYYDCNLMPREDSGHITVSFADGIHASGAAGDLVIENCNFANTHDDPINLHGTFTRVEERRDSRTLVLKYIHNQQGGFPQFHAGDQVAFFTRDTLESTDHETLYTVEEVVSNPGENGNDLRTMVIRFQEDLPQNLSDQIGNEPKYVAENVTYAPSVTIRNCTFAKVPTRGILCTTRNPVLIEGNTFKQMSMATIFLSNDSDQWYESGPIRNMVIKNNEFFIKSIGRTSWEYAPAVYVHPVTKGGSLPSADQPIHKNITIEGNTFHMDTDTVVKAESVENLTIRNNKVLRMNPDIRLEISADRDQLLVGDMLTVATEAEGNTHTRPQDNVYEFTKCKNVVLEGNTYDDGLKQYAVLSNMPDAYLSNRDPDIKIAYDREQPVTDPVRNIGYVSSNPEVLSIDANGKMVAREAGEASVYAYYMWNGEKIISEPIEMKVSGKGSVAPEDTVSITWEGEPVLTELNETLRLSASTASQKEIVWSVEDFLTGGTTAAAVIDQNGVLTAKRSGIVWVRASAGLSTDRIAVVIRIQDEQVRNADLSVLREETSDYTLTGDRITVNMKTGDLFESSNTVKNLFLYQIPEDVDKDNLRAVLKVDHLPERESNQWDTASFLLYQNDDNYISVGKKSHYDGITTVVETNASGTETGGNAEQNELTSAYFGFCKKGDSVSVDFKEENGTWKHIRDISASMLSDGYRIGFAAWATTERGKSVDFSEFYLGSGDSSYEQLCGQPAISFFEKQNTAPSVSGAALDKTAYKIGDTANVSYVFEDKDGDPEGKTLYCFSYDNGIKEITDQPRISLAYTGTILCEVYPVDAKVMPGAKAVTAAASVTQESDQPPKDPPKDPSKEDETDKNDPLPLPRVGTSIHVEGMLYQITKSDVQNGTASAVKLLDNKRKSIVIPKIVEKDGYQFRVTEIKKQACKGAKNIRSVVIGENVTKIGASAFLNCTRLKKITFQSKKAPKFGKKAWKGIVKKCKITVPKQMTAKQLRKLKKAVKKAGAGSKVTYKKK